MAGIKSFTPPKDLPSAATEVPAENLKQRQLISKSLGADYSSLESKDDKAE